MTSPARWGCSGPWRTSNNMSELKFRITNLNCEACAKVSELALKKLPGVTAVHINEKTGEAYMVGEQTIEFAVVGDCLAEKGFKASLE